MPEKVQTVILHVQIIREKIHGFSTPPCGMYCKCKISLCCSLIERIENELGFQKRDSIYSL